MPVSGDEYDMISTNQYQVHPGMSKAEQRKSNKPIMEKRRRARINHCLNELKSLILDALKKDPARHSKLEKADILEMTVKHLQSIQQQQLTIAMATDPTVVQKFKTGFNECATEVSRYIGRMDGIEPCVKQRLVSHLASCVSGLKKMPAFSLPATSTTQQSGALSEDVNNNNASARLQMMTGVQLIPSRLPTGELALLLPNSQQIPGNMISFFPPSQEANLVTTTSDQVHTSTLTNKTIDRHHFSAFTAVNRHRSPLPSPSSSTASIYCEDSTDQPYPSPSNVHEVSSTSEHEKTKHDYDSLAFRVKPMENLLQISTEPYQSDPVRNRASFSAFTSNTVQKNLLTPLTVITSGTVVSTSKTSNNTTDVRFQHPANMKLPVDFSLKKDPVPLLLPSKRPYPEDDLLDTKPDTHKALKTDFDGEKGLDLRYELSPPESAKPSTSNSDTARDMWRPW